MCVWRWERRVGERLTEEVAVGGNRLSQGLKDEFFRWEREKGQEFLAETVES